MYTSITYTIFLFIELALALLMLAYLHSSVISLWRGAPFVPTKQEFMRAILQTAHLQKDMVFLELGCGDGRMVCLAVKRYGVRGIGVDVSRLWLWIGILRARIMGIAHTVTFLHQNILDTDMSEADVIYVYMMPRFLEAHGDVFITKAKRGAVVLSHTFEIQSLKAFEQKQVHHGPVTTYVYKLA